MTPEELTSLFSPSEYRVPDVVTSYSPAAAAPQRVAITR
jgi:hypothetical protein